MAVIEKALMGSSTPVPPETVHRALDRIVASEAFTRSPRLTKFLRYIVEQSLEGHGPELKEYVLAEEVFGRKSGFDPRIDPIVRVEAGRLRRRLKEHYRREGKDDEVRIECAKGGYAVMFRTPAAPAWKPEVRKPKRRECPAIAVLPFHDLSPEKDQEYFCDGITEELIGLLTQIEGMRVASSMSAFTFKGKSEDIRTIGRKLNVSAIVEGSVRKDGDRLRITARLTDVNDGFERWSETHQRSTRDIFLIQNEISQSIVANVKHKLLGYDAQPLVERHTQNPEAYRMYLRGRHHWNQRTEAGLQTGIQYFKQAITIDPGYALAFAGVADSYAILGTRGALAPVEAMPRSEKAAL
jgi:serine/threonine-protein kinase